jgi:anaerobic magnesium-protoporphyrin IX monomethyl ester cyclase
MSFQKVLLVSPLSSSRYGGLRVPAGIGHIAQALYDNSIEYKYVDLRIRSDFKELKKKISEFKPDLVGISMITLGYEKTYRMISYVKTLLPKVKIVVGGHHVTILKETVLEGCKDIDFGVVADGERTIVELCKNGTPYENIKGLIFREDQQIVFTGERPPVNNLDEYAFPRYMNFNMKDYSKQIPIQSSRGCVGKCTFCPNKVIGRKFRKKSTSYFVDEIEYWRSRGYRQFAIDDDNFTLINERVYEICDEIERRGLKDLLIRCSNGIRADRVDRQLLLRMKEIGVREVGFGVDGGNDKVLGYLKKNEKMETIDRAVKTACEVGLDVKIFIIVGTPHETMADIEDSIKFARKYPVARVNFNNAIPYPGTEMYSYVKEHNLFLIPPEKYLNNVAEDMAKESFVPVFETPELPKEARVQMLKRCHEVEVEVMKNTAYRMYKRYPFTRFLIKHFFNVTLFERLFFKNLTLRKIFESIRYRKLIKR